MLLLGFGYFFTLLCSYYLLRPLRDAMGLVGGADELQWLFTLTFVAMLALVPVFGALVRRMPPRQFVTVVYRFFACNILVFCLLIYLGVREQHVARFFFVWVSVYNLFVVSIFWSVLADRFTAVQAKRLFGFVAAGGTAGTFVGPALAAGLAQTLGPAFLTLAAAVLLEIALQCCRRLLDAPAKSAVDDAPRMQAVGGGILGGATLILRSPYLIAIVCYMFLHTSTATFLYFEQGRLVAESVIGTAARTRFFAQVDLLVSTLTLLLQLFITGRLMRRYGVSLALLLLPLAAVLAFGAVAIWPGLLVLAIVQGVRRAADFALARPAREVLFTVLSREEKYKAKNFIDTVVYRGGDAVSGWLSAGLGSLGVQFGGITIIMLPFLLLWGWLASWLGRRQGSFSPQRQRQE